MCFEDLIWTTWGLVKSYIVCFLTLKMQLNCSALKPKHVRLGKCCYTPGFVRKKKTFWPLWLLFTHVSLQSIRASPLGACRATSAIYSVCVFNTSTPVTCQRPHKLVNPIGFVRLLRAERLIVLMGGRKKARGKERKKRRWVDEGYEALTMCAKT